MHTSFFRPLTVSCGILLINLLGSVHAGAPSTDFKSGKDVDLRPEPETVPGSVTIGTRFSDHLTDGYIDLLQPVWATPNHMLAFDVRSQLNDRDQDVYSFGSVFRYLVPDRDLIFGVNAFYDYLESQHGNHFDQLGLGAEMLSHWVDARFNYYLPDDSSYIIDQRTTRRTSTSSDTSLVNGVPTRTTTTTTRTTSEHRLESGLEGFYTEAGFLVPELDRYFELRIFGGYYHYNNPFGHDFRGFQTRAEARFLPGLIADVGYYEDKYFMGGHWVTEVRVEMPFDLVNLVHGKNPFEGALDAFRPGAKREFRSRMGEMVLRSPLIKTITSNFKQDGATDTDKKTTSAPLPPIASPTPNPGGEPVEPVEPIQPIEPLIPSE